MSNPTTGNNGAYSMAWVGIWMADIINFGACEARQHERIESRGGGWYRLDGKQMRGYKNLRAILYEEWKAA